MSTERLGGREGATGETAPPVPARARVSLLSGAGWTALQTYNYRVYFAGQLISQTGSWMQRIAQAWLVLDLTGSAAALGLLTALQFLPITLLSLPAGVLVDRFPKHRFILVIQAVATVQGLLLAGIVLAGMVELWHVYALAFLLGLVTAFDQPSRQAFVGELVPREQIQSAVGLNSSLFNAARIAGPGIGGVIIAAWGVGWCFLFNGLSYVAVLVALLLLRTDELYGGRPPRSTALWHQLVDGVRYVARTPELAAPLALLAVMGTFGYNFSVALPLLARDTLDVGAIGFGALNAAMGVGSLFGALAVATRVKPSPRARLLAAGGFGLLLGVVALVPWYWVALVLLVALGIASVTYSAMTNTTLQLESREDYRGRVLSLYTLLFAGSTPLGGAVTGFLADAWGIQVTLLVEAGCCLLATAAGVLWTRRHPAASIAPLDQPSPAHPR